MLDDIPKVLLSDDIAHQKVNNIKEERKRKNYILSQSQNYLKLTDQQKINLDIEKNIKFINEVEDNLFNKEDKAIKINQN